MAEGVEPELDEAVIVASTNREVIQETAELWANAMVSFLEDYGNASLEQKTTEDQQAKALACQRLSTLGYRMGIFFQRAANELGSDEGCKLAREVTDEVVNQSINEQLAEVSAMASRAMN